LRLTHIKLAGFKSFVDPVNIPTPGQRVGIVGPNGCGKSNVIDAVRWVLGESSAKHLRGETMQDVIFSGSATRKPVGRASVELIFDNNLGKAAGQWSQYAEVAVKRVLHRNGESAYYINNVHVRRRDVQDIFLGTGLGARAYAIIEQGMISRIIEARPEELRIFLEEAAGISKYKDRRKETESRLKDARENLLRVDDIRQELDKQLERLETQAEVARRYLSLQQQLHFTQNLLWLLKKREAGAQCERWQREIQRLANELEGETARLRQAENQLETAREAHYAASDALHDAQGELYTANAEVARLEQSLQHQRESRQRLAGQLASIREQHSRLHKQKEDAQAGLRHWQEELARAEAGVEESRQRLDAESGNLPKAEELLRDCQHRYADMQRSLSQAEQSGQIEETHRNHAQRTLQQLQGRHARLQQEQAGLPAFDGTALEQKEAELEEADAELEDVRMRLAELEDRLPDAEHAARETAQTVRTGQEQATRLEARLNALNHLQTRLDHDQKLQAWLGKHRLDGLSRLWQSLSVEAGWEDALEAVLRDRLNGIALPDLDTARDFLADPPPAAVTVFGSQPADGQQQPAEDLLPLRHVVSWSGGVVPAFLDDWLGSVYAVEEAGQAFSLRTSLPPGAWLVCREGHLFSRSSISFHAPQSELHGVLARQREIEQLEAELCMKRGELEVREKEAVHAAAGFKQLQDDITGLRRRAQEAQQAHHRLQLEVQRLGQVKQQVEQRRDQIGADLEEIAAQMVMESEQIAASEENLEHTRQQIEALREQVEELRDERSEAEAKVNGQRETLRAAERMAQEADFFRKTCSHKIIELENSINVLDEQAVAVEEQLESLLLAEQEFDEGPMQEALQQAVAQRQQREEGLAAARDALAEAANLLREIEQQRMASEQKLHPLREQIGDGRLKEQEARLNQEQFAEQLQGAGADEAALAPHLEKGVRAGGLQSEITRLNGEIEGLGAVNLAAVEELESGKERKTYLEAQAKDLNEAIETLEQAIRRIDRETRERLQATFDQVNGHFSEMFPSLFGGGQARLVLTGDEILDAGVQIVAQPPGKKNSSIHLLSGGEKALTALSLTFSMFQLNPAPFCLLDEVDAPLDDSNTERFCELVKKMSQHTQFLFISHNKIAMEMAEQLIGVTMQELGASRVVAVDIEEAMRITDAVSA
jgi:chromosome segregation protein